MAESEFGFYLVEVTEEWSASCKVLVADPSREAAEKTAEMEIDFDSLDAESDGTIARVRKVLTLTELEELRQQPAAGPNGHCLEPTAYIAKPFTSRSSSLRWEGEGLPLDEFLERFADPEAVARWRLAERERNNGQIPLPLEVA